MIVSHWSDIAAFFEAIPGKVEGFFGSAATWLEKAGEDVLHGLITGLEYTSPLYVVYKYRSDILSAVSDAATWLYDAGKDIIEGLIHGVEDAAGGAVKAVENVGKDIINGAKSVLSIFSPSAVFQELGGNLMQGMAIGITNEAGTAHAALNKAINGLVPTSSATGAGANVAGGVAGAVTPTAASAPGRTVQISQVFNTPMSAPAVANEVGWALRIAPV
jgi:hypothetical protein